MALDKKLDLSQETAETAGNIVISISMVASFLSSPSSLSSSSAAAQLNSRGGTLLLKKAQIVT